MASLPPPTVLSAAEDHINLSSSNISDSETDNGYVYSQVEVQPIPKSDSQQDDQQSTQSSSLLLNLSDQSSSETTEEKHEKKKFMFNPNAKEFVPSKPAPAHIQAKRPPPQISTVQQQPYRIIYNNQQMVNMPGLPIQTQQMIMPLPQPHYHHPAILSNSLIQQQQNQQNQYQQFHQQQLHQQYLPQLPAGMLHHNQELAVGQIQTSLQTHISAPMFLHQTGVPNYTPVSLSTV